MCAEVLVQRELAFMLSLIQMQLQRVQQWSTHTRPDPGIKPESLVAHIHDNELFPPGG